jgi:hypothetical protein
MMVNEDFFLRFKELQGFEILVDIGKLQKLGIYSAYMIVNLFQFFIEYKSPEDQYNSAHIKHLSEIGATDVAKRFAESSHNGLKGPAITVLRALFGSIKKVCKKAKLDPLTIVKQTLQQLEIDDMFMSRSNGIQAIIGLSDIPVIKEFLYEELLTKKPKHWKLVLTCSKEEIESSKQMYLRK